MQNRIVSLLIFLFISSVSTGQRCENLGVHSHNDYHHEIPFWGAYEAGATSIEVDVFLKNETLFVTHAEAEIKPGRDVELLYLKPLQKTLSDKFESDNRKIQLLIDIKSDAYKTLEKLIEVLNKYPDLTGNEKVVLVISGNRPKPEEYTNYPRYILFDYQSLQVLNNKELNEKIALVSLPFYKYSSWDGLSELPEIEIAKITALVKMANDFGKPFRLWATPDTELSWKTLANLGVCFINTDHPKDCYDYLIK